MNSVVKICNLNLITRSPASFYFLFSRLFIPQSQTIDYYRFVYAMANLYSPFAAFLIGSFAFVFFSIKSYANNLVV